MDQEGIHVRFEYSIYTSLILYFRKFDLFSKDVILIPINRNNSHWTAAAINFRKKRIHSYDSMGTAGSQFVTQALRKYLDEEHREKKKKPFDFTGWVDWVDEVCCPQRTAGLNLTGPTSGNTATRERLRLRRLCMSVLASPIQRRGRRLRIHTGGHAILAAKDDLGDC